MIDDTIIFSEVLEPPDDSWLYYLSKPQVNIINMHTALYGLFLIYSEESDSSDNIFTKAAELLDTTITPDQLYDIMGADAGGYKYDLNSVTTYAEKIINFKI